MNLRPLRRPRATWLLAMALIPFVAFAACRPAVVGTSPRLQMIAAPSNVLADASTYWPMWRGDGTGVSAASGLPVTFDAMDGVRWQIALPGVGNSSPIVWQDRLIVTAVIDGQPAVCCYNRLTGATLWTTPVTSDTETGLGGAAFASATAATDGELIFACFGSQGLFALDMQGNLQWHTSLGPLKQIWSEASSPMQLASSTLVLGDLVIQLADGRDASHLVAFHKQTGELVWKTPRMSHGCWSTPVAVTTSIDQGGETELVVNGTGVDQRGAGQMIAYDPGTGSPLWNIQGTTDIVCPSPIVADDLVISTSGRNGPFMAVRTGGRGELNEDQVAWSRASGGPYVPTGVAYQGRLFTVSDRGQLDCRRLADGELLWSQRLGGSFTASLVAGDDKIYAVSEQGTVFVFAAADQPQKLAANEMGDRVMASPAIAAGDLFLRTQRFLYCIAGQGDETAEAFADAVATAEGEISRESTVLPVSAISPVDKE